VGSMYDSHTCVIRRLCIEYEGVFPSPYAIEPLVEYESFKGGPFAVAEWFVCVAADDVNIR